MARADEVLEAVLGPLDGPAEPHRRVRDQDLLGIEEHDLRAEAAPGVGRDDLHLELRQPEDPREAVLDRERRLRRAPHPELAGPRVVLGHDAARLDRAPAAPLDVRAAPGARGRPCANAASGSPTRWTTRAARFPGTSAWTRGAPGSAGRLEVGDHRQAARTRRRSARRRPRPRSDRRPRRTRPALPCSAPRRPQAAAGSADGSAPDGGSGAGEGWLSSPSSAAVRTRCTPGSARARAVSIAPTRACPCGERRPAAWSTPRGSMSSTNDPSPRRSRGSSFRGMRAPIKRVVMVGPAPSRIAPGLCPRAILARAAGAFLPATGVADRLFGGPRRIPPIGVP